MRKFCISSLRRAAAGVAALSVCTTFAATAAAQVSVSYADTTVGAIGNPGQACNTAFTRTINVPDNITITDLDVGLIIDHNNRSDLAMALRSPAGTQVTLFFGGGGALDDYNIRLDQQSGTVMNTGSHNVNNNVAAAPYQHNVRPSLNSLNTFNGENAQGNWLLLACDNVANSINGQYLRSEIFVTGTQDFADLRLDMTASNNSPSYGSNVTMTLTATHEGGSLPATSVMVDYDLPNGMTFVSATPSGTSSFNPGTGIWDIGTIAPGTAQTLTVTAEVLSTGTHTNFAEIVTSAVIDPDSTTNNSATNPSEDDTAAVTLTPGSSGGTGPSGEPILSCAAPSRFDWDTNAWPYDVGVLSRTYSPGGSDGTAFTVTYSGDTAFRDTNSPSTSADMTGGIVPAEQSLYYFQNLSAPGTSVDVTIDVGAPGTGVQDFQMSVFDIDFAAGQFRDRLQVQGFLNGAAVTPILTSGSANSSVGAVAVGTVAADNTTANGTVIVTFLSPVDQVVYNYSNPEASSGTSNQAMALYDFEYCPRARDYGDAPSSYGGPEHLISGGVFIGATPPDGEASAQVSVGADGDDLANSDDEDNLDFSSLIAGAPGSVDVNLTGSGGFLQMWIDWNGDGDFNDTVDGQSEQVASDVQIVGTTGTATVSFTVPASATLTQTIARLRWSNTPGLSSNAAATSGEVEDHAFTLTGAAVLSGSKVTSIFDPTSIGLYALPGNDVIYTITVQNAGDGPTDVDTVFLVDRIPDEVEFWNGDIDGSGPDTFAGTDPVGFSQLNGAALTFAYGSDVAFATGSTAPTDFSGCSLTTPDNTYRPDLTFICFNPKGQLAAGDPDPEFSVSFRARIK